MTIHHISIRRIQLDADGGIHFDFGADITPHQTGLIIMRGLPASGKTTYAHNFVRARRAAGYSAIRIGRDDIRNMLCLSEQPRQKCHGCGKDEETVTLMETRMIGSLFRSGAKWIVEDSTNLHDVSVYRLAALAADLDVQTFMVHMTTGVEECVARDALRMDPCGEDVIRRMAEYAEEPRCDRCDRGK